MGVIRVLVRDLLRHPALTVAYAFGIGVGAATYLLLVSATTHFSAQFAQAKKLLGADVVVQRARASSPFMWQLREQEAAKLASFPGVQTVLRLGFGSVDVVGDRFFMFYGLEPDPMLSRSMRSLEGRMPVDGAPEAAVGIFAAERLGLRVGSTLLVRDVPLRIVGVYQCGHSLLDNGGIAPLDVVQRLFDKGDQLSAVLLRLAPGADPEAVAQAIAQAYPALEATPTERWISLYGQVRLVESYVGTIGVIAIAVALFVVLSVLQLNIVTRLPEFAILRAVGWVRWRIAALVAGEALALAFFGALLAPGIGEWILLLLRPLNREAVGFVTDHVELTLWPKTTLLTLAAGLAGAVLPLSRVLRVAPAQVLRTP